MSGFGLQSAMANVNAAMAVHAVAVPLRDSVKSGMIPAFVSASIRLTDNRRWVRRR
jgi:hypothetical protein